MPGRLIVIVLAGSVLVAALGLVLYVAERPAATPAADVSPAPATDTAERAEDPAREIPPSAPPERPVAPAPPSPPVETTPTTGSLRIESDVPDTSVFVDREYLGSAPITTRQLAPGPHTVLLSPTGYESISEVVEVAAGEERAVSISFRTIRLDASIAVVHKHTFGSCEGLLRGSPDGLTYETTDEDDAVTVRFADLETFEVDYLDTNLRMKIRDGKTYNFTDPEGDADRLFVFHRDVEKVRIRVVGGGNERP